MNSNVDVIILVCGLSNESNDRRNDSRGRSSWNNCDFDGESSWNCNDSENFFDSRDRNCNSEDLVVKSSSDKRIKEGTNAAKAIEELLSKGYKLVAVESLCNRRGRIVFIFVKSSSPRCQEQA